VNMSYWGGVLKRTNRSVSGKSGNKMVSIVKINEKTFCQNEREGSGLGEDLGERGV